MVRPSFFHRAILVAALALALGAVSAHAQDTPQLQTNQSYVEDVTRATAVNAGDPMAVFGFVMSKLPERVVWPLCASVVPARANTKFSGSR